MRLTDYLGEASQSGRRADTPPLVGVLEGAGIGPSLISAALEVLESVGRVVNVRFDVRRGGLIGEDAIARHGTWLPDGTIAFCDEILNQGGAILSGPGGGRYVYDLRRRFNLFCKLVPVRPAPELARAGVVRTSHAGLDLLIVRDNIAGVYQGDWTQQGHGEARVATHTFSYREPDVRRIVTVAARAAASRRGGFTVVVKDGGVPAISELWRDVATNIGDQWGVAPRFINVDALAYEIIRYPERFDVIVAPNLFGDIIADLTGVLIGSRGLTFSGNFDSLGRGVYQTNHGCAHDLVGTDTANPGAQLLSLAMLLREAFGLDHAATLIEHALASVWREGWRTADIAEPGCRIVGTGAMTERVAKSIEGTAARIPA
jgi:3-isopropylmalate dehydrogenase